MHMFKLFVLFCGEQESTRGEDIKMIGSPWVVLICNKVFDVQSRNCPARLLDDLTCEALSCIELHKIIGLIDGGTGLGW